MLLFTLAYRGKVHTYLSDLFLPGYALTTCLWPYASYQALVENLELADFTADSFIYAHSYADNQGYRLSVEVDRATVSQQQNHLRNFHNDYIFEEYNRYRHEHPELSGIDLFRQLFQEIIRKTETLRIFLIVNLHWGFSDPPKWDPSLIGRVVYYAWLINLYARQPATRVESQEGRFAELYMRNTKKPADKDYPVVDAIRLTRYGKPLETFASNEFQMAILLNIAIANLLQECENQINV